MTLLIFSFVGSAAAYVLAGTLNFTKRGGVSVAGKARLHLSLLAAALLPGAGVPRVSRHSAPAHHDGRSRGRCTARPIPT